MDLDHKGNIWARDSKNRGISWNHGNWWQLFIHSLTTNVHTYKRTYHMPTVVIKAMYNKLLMVLLQAFLFYRERKSVSEHLWGINMNQIELYLLYSYCFLNVHNNLIRDILPSSYKETKEESSWEIHLFHTL